MAVGALLRSSTKAVNASDAAGELLRRGMQGDKVAEEAVKEYIKVYHGSPHDFEQFMLDAIGTGEGAQAYGWGLYFAEVEDVAKGYRDALSQPRILLGGRPLGDVYTADIRNAFGGTYEKIIDEAIEKQVDKFGKAAKKAGLNDVDAEFAALDYLEASKKQLMYGSSNKELDDAAFNATLNIKNKFGEAGADLIDNMFYDLEDTINNIDITIANLGQASNKTDFDYIVNNYLEPDQKKLYSKYFSKDIKFDTPEGKLYEVNLNTSPDELLDWDKPLSQQSEKVKSLYKDLNPPQPPSSNMQQLLDSITPEQSAMLERAPDIMDTITGERFYNNLAKSKGFNDFISNELKAGRLKMSDTNDIPRMTSRYLESKGIKGIRYDDGMSRGKDGGTSNYVVFDPSIIEIAKKYGVALPVAAGIASGMTPQEAEASFIGAIAKNADRYALAMAQKMENAGLSPKEIWKKTGWERGADNQWVTEIPDNLATYDTSGMPTTTSDGFTYKTGNLPEGLQHQDLYDAVPELANTKLTDYPFSGDSAGTFRSSYDFYGKEVPASITLWKEYVQPVNVALHETQHNLQDIMGFAKGASAKTVTKEDIYNSPLYKKWREEGPVRDEIRDLVQSPQYVWEMSESNRIFSDQYEPIIDELENKLDSAANESEVQDIISAIDKTFADYRAYASENFPALRQVVDLDRTRTVKTEPTERDIYRSAAGEVQARNVESRRTLDYETRRATPPSETEDVPRDQQWVKGVTAKDYAKAAIAAALPSAASQADEFDASQPSGITVGKQEQDVYRPSAAEAFYNSQKAFEDSIYTPSDPEDFDVSQYQNPERSGLGFFKGLADTAGPMITGGVSDILGFGGDIQSLYNGLVRGISEYANDGEFWSGFGQGIQEETLLPVPEYFSSKVPYGVQVPFGSIPQEDIEKIQLMGSFANPVNPL